MSIYWDRPCYKCRSHTCDMTCPEPDHLAELAKKDAENLGYAKSMIDLEAEVKRLTALVASTATTYDDALAAAQERNAQLRSEVAQLKAASVAWCEVEKKL